MYSPSYVRVLVVDDFKSFRQFLITTLRQLPEVQEIFEAEDGLEAVAKTEELRPDLILLDIGLPNLNGIEAAKLIRRSSPESKILFVSQESSPDVVRLALQVGGQGYVVKRDAGNDLVTAIRILLSGHKFVGARFAGNDFFENSDERQEIRRHEMLVYSDEAAFFEGFTQFAGRRLIDGDAVVVVATEQHRNGLLSRLQLFGVDIASAMEQRRYIALDSAETLKAILVNGMPDRERFSKVAGELMLGVAKAAHLETHRIAACGECAPMLWGEPRFSLNACGTMQSGSTTWRSFVDIRCIGWKVVSAVKHSSESAQNTQRSSPPSETFAATNYAADALSAAFCLTSGNCLLSILNSVKPQSRQTERIGNKKVAGIAGLARSS